MKFAPILAVDMMGASVVYGRYRGFRKTAT